MQSAASICHSSSAYSSASACSRKTKHYRSPYRGPTFVITRVQQSSTAIIRLIVLLMQESQGCFKVYGEHLYTHILAAPQRASDLMRMVSINIKEAFEALLHLALLPFAPGGNSSEWLPASPKQALGLLIGSLYNM